MKRFNFKKALPYLLIIVGFAVVAYAYSPYVLEGKIVNQSDISSWRGMANEALEYNESHPDDKTLWTGSMFSGMPTFSITAEYEGDWLDPLYNFLFLGKRPPSYLLISLIGGFLLFLAFGTNKWLAVLGAIAITFCSYNMQIIQVGHNTKMVAIAFMPWVLASLVYAYRKNMLWGALFFAFTLSFQIKANHPQITYYLAIIVIGYAIAELCGAIKSKTFTSFMKTSLIVLVAGLLGIATNANKLIPIYEYSKYTMRGGSELTHDEDVQTGSGLKMDYATAWSYGIEETPNLMIPNFNGGASVGALSTSSETYKVLKSSYQGGERMIRQMPLYWGPQPFTAGPMYMGAICVFLFVLGLAIIKGRYKWWIAGVSLVALFLAWGSHFMWFSELFFKYAPMYNKFRTVSMILVILQITIPVMGVLAINTILSEDPDVRPDMKRMKRGLGIALGITAGFSLLFALFPSLAGSFSSSADAGYAGHNELLGALIDDRKSLLQNDAFRSLTYILISAAILWLGYKRKLKMLPVIAILAGLILVDLWTIDKRYLNKTHFMREREFENQFAMRPVDKMILEDQDPNYRVLDLSVNTFNDAIVSYHHKTIGGYSPAKLQRYQDLIDFYISSEMSSMTKDLNSAISTAKTVKDLEAALGSYPILSMLNTKYVVIDGNNPPLEYGNRLGNAWFVSEAVTAKTADEEIAVLGTINPAEKAVLFDTDASSGSVSTFDASGNIELTGYAPNHLKYRSSSDSEALAVFSEIYYPAGWSATIDGEPAEIRRANFALRALLLPAGDHEIQFDFHPKTYDTGRSISLASSIAIIVFLLLLVGFQVRTCRRKPL